LPDVGSYSDPDISWVDSLAYPQSPVFDDDTAGGIPPDDAFTVWARHLSNSARPEGGRQEGALTAVLEHYLPHVAQTYADLIAFPVRKPVPEPEGLSLTDSNEYLVNGRPIEESPEGRAWLEDQRRARDWVPALVLAMFSSGRLASRGAPPGAIGAFVGRKPPRRTPQHVLDQTYRDPPRTLWGLQNAVPNKRDGTQVHHIVERVSEREGFSEAKIYGFENEVRIPTLKHREITSWYQTKNKFYDWMSPREYLRGKTWEDHRSVGLLALKKFGVSK
jgi:hypothetical protein